MWGPRRTTGNDVAQQTQQAQQAQQAQQLKAIARLSMELRADSALQHIFSVLVEAIHSTLGYQAAALNLVRSESEMLEVVAVAGLSPADGQHLMRHPPQLSRLMAAMQNRFRIRNSYFIGHEDIHVLDGVTIVTSHEPAPARTAPGAWHKDDMFLVPLTSLRDRRLLAILSLDQPANGRIPTAEDVEIVELFADQAALAIENCLLFQEREYRQESLRHGIARIMAALDQVRQGNLSSRADASDPALAPLTESLNTVVAALESVLGDVREAGGTVANSAGSMRATATHLANQINQHSDRMLEVSQEVQFMAENVRQIAETASEASISALQAIDLSNNGRNSAEHAAAEMQHVREMTLQTVKKFERLRDAIQRIGTLAQTVSEYAQQTNLLTINATLQAMHAGEDGGRSFSIVAREIRDLAGNTADAARQISGVLQELHLEAEQTARIIIQSSEQVERQSSLAADAGAAMADVDVATQQITEAIRSISDTATRQANGALTIAKATADIADLTREDRQSVDRMHTAMDHLVGLADSLLGLVAFFHGSSGSHPSSASDAGIGAEAPGWAVPVPGMAAPVYPPLPGAFQGQMPIAPGTTTGDLGAGFTGWSTSGARSAPSSPSHPGSATPSVGVGTMGTMGMMDTASTSGTPPMGWPHLTGEASHSTDTTPGGGVQTGRSSMFPMRGALGPMGAPSGPSVPRLVPLDDPAPRDGASSSPALPAVPTPTERADEVRQQGDAAPGSPAASDPLGPPQRG